MALWLPSAAIGQRTLKVKHAEPLYLDLVRDLGARRGEQEWNMGSTFRHAAAGLTLHPFLEYEWAPVNRLGAEIEVPLYAGVVNPQTEGTGLRLGVHSLKASLQWTVLVRQRGQLSAAMGYTQENYGKQAIEHRPCLVMAKRWGRRFHTLAYTAAITHTLEPHWYGELNLAAYYTSPGRKLMWGTEFYRCFKGAESYTAIRPQVKMALGPRTALGVVYSICPQTAAQQSLFLRLIYEPAPKSRKRSA
ncbi:MAG: hypothetical protein KF690_10360 [Bacteroidetes bacterium]|nr:hypothetical protein [Bacteroidota bacterium]